MSYEKNLTTSEVTTHYFLSGKEIAFRKGSILEYLHTDHLGSTSVTTDSSGAQLGKVAYFPFGGVRSTIGALDTDKLFTGQRLDQTGLYFYNARYYDATIGRFISPDTIVPSPANPQSLNRYSYCLNNPLRYTDPSGHAIRATITAAPPPAPKPPPLKLPGPSMISTNPGKTTTTPGNSGKPATPATTPGNSGKTPTTVNTSPGQTGVQQTTGTSFPFVTAVPSLIASPTIDYQALTQQPTQSNNVIMRAATPGDQGVSAEQYNKNLALASYISETEPAVATMNGIVSLAADLIPKGPNVIGKADEGGISPLDVVAATEFSAASVGIWNPYVAGGIFLLWTGTLIYNALQSEK